MSSLARARWSHLLAAEPARVPTAYAYESVVDELVFVAGPVLVTAIAVGVSPAAGIGVAGLALTVGALWLSLLRSTEPPVVRLGRTATALRVAGIRVVALVCVGLGAAFGSLDVGVVAVAEREGNPAAAGLVLGLVAVGSAGGGLWYGARTWVLPLPRLLALGCLVLAASGLALQVGERPLLLAGPALLTGLAIAPTLITAYGLVDRLVPARSRTEGLTWVAASVAVGVAAGAAVTGALVEPVGPVRALLVVPAGAALAAAAAIVGRRALARCGPGHERPGSAPGTDTAHEAAPAPGRVG